MGAECELVKKLRKKTTGESEKKRRDAALSGRLRTLT